MRNEYLLLSRVYQARPLEPFIVFTCIFLSDGDAATWLKMIPWWYWLPLHCVFCSILQTGIFSTQFEEFTLYLLLTRKFCCGLSWNYESYGILGYSKQISYPIFCELSMTVLCMEPSLKDQLTISRSICMLPSHKKYPANPCYIAMQILWLK